MKYLNRQSTSSNSYRAFNHVDFDVGAPKTIDGRVLSEEISQCLAFDSFLGHILQTKLGQRHCPFPNSTFYDWSGEHVADDVGLGNDLCDQWEHVMPKLGGGEKYDETKFLDDRIIDLWLIEISTEVENSLLSSSIVVLHEEAADGLFDHRDI
ncbi:hypothetical protein ACFX1X_015234 [Malus domestica]